MRDTAQKYGGLLYIEQNGDRFYLPSAKSCLATRIRKFLVRSGMLIWTGHFCRPVRSHGQLGCCYEPDGSRTGFGKAAILYSSAVDMRWHITWSAVFSWKRRKKRHGEGSIYWYQESAIMHLQCWQLLLQWL